MALLEQIARASFLGEEFLTWLWFLSETRRDPLPIPQVGACQIAMGQEMILGGETGDAQTVVLRGEMPSASVEARQALSAGKQLRRAKLYLTLDSIQWALTIIGSTLAISGLRVPGPSGADFEQHCQLRLEAIERISRAIDWLFEQFLQRRLDPERWEKEVRALTRWASGK